MGLVKVSRLTETPSHEDSVKDLIAYAALYKTILDAEMDADWGSEAGEWIEREKENGV
jgi:hypothetical protein